VGQGREARLFAFEDLGRTFKSQAIMPRELHDAALGRDVAVEDAEAAAPLAGRRTPEPAVAKTMLLGGAGIGWLPDFDTRDALAAGTLVRILPDHQSDGVDIHALYPSHRSLSAKVRVFIDALVEHMKSAES